MVRALPRSGLAVLNGDDPNVRWMATQTPARVLTFGFEPGNDVRAEGLETLGVEGSRFTLVVGGQPRVVRSRLLGRTMVSSVLTTVAVALGEGVELDGAITALERLRTELVGRLQPVTLASGAVLLRDDHKAPLETVHAALDVLAEMPAGRAGSPSSATSTSPPIQNRRTRPSVSGSPLLPNGRCWSAIRPVPMWSARNGVGCLRAPW